MQKKYVCVAHFLLVKFACLGIENSKPLLPTYTGSNLASILDPWSNNNNVHGMQLHNVQQYYVCTYAPRVNDGHRRRLYTHEVIPMEHDIQTKYHTAGKILAVIKFGKLTTNDVISGIGRF